MKIGLALSGSGPGAAAAHAFADELDRCSVRLHILSATSLATVSGLLWSRGATTEEIGGLMCLFDSGEPAIALRQIVDSDAMAGGERCPFAASSTDIATGITAVFSDVLVSDAWNLRTFPLRGNEESALTAAVSLGRALPPAAWQGMQLCDFSTRYGCPFFPLRMYGAERLLSVTFAGGETPAQIAAERLAALTGRNADLHYNLCLRDADDPEQEVRTFVQEHITEIYHKLLF